jgi:hypothetical protein
MAKDETEIGITGKPIPKKKRSPKKQYQFEKERRQNLGPNVGGHTYRSDVSPNFNPRSVREEVLSYLLDEGFASDEKSAEAIMDAMSEAWVESIVEAKQEEGKSKEEKQKIRTERSGFTGPHANNERRGAHGDRDERNKDLADLRKGKKKNSSYFSYLP